MAAIFFGQLLSIENFRESLYIVCNPHDIVVLKFEQIGLFHINPCLKISDIVFQSCNRLNAVLLTQISPHVLIVYVHEAVKIDTS